MSFAYVRARTVVDAHDHVTNDRYVAATLKGGGMDLVDEMKEGLISPDLLVDVRDIPAPKRSGHAIGAATTLSEIAESSDIQSHAPVITHACGSAATPQVRNVATAAGNLLQRPRCWYFRNQTFDCLKKGGHKCFAVEGDNHYHAIFGDGPCYIVHPSNLAVALMVCDAKVNVSNGEQERAIPIGEFYHLPADGLRTEHDLSGDDVVVDITYSAAPNSGFHAIKHKQSFDWPLVMAAVALDLDGTTIRSARVCAGAVAPIPWALPRVADALAGVDLDDRSALDRACAISRDGARPLAHNAYKLHLLPVAIRRAVLEAGGRDA